MPELFERMSKNLEVIDPIFEEFIGRTSFERQLSGVGRYPRRRVSYEEDGVCRWIDLMMDLDDAGDRFMSWTSDRPFSLGAGATFDKPGLRYFIDQTILDHAPFDSIRGLLPGALNRCRDYVEGIHLRDLLNVEPYPISNEPT